MFPDSKSPDVLTPTARTRPGRRPQRVAYDRALIHAILDEAPLCHVGVTIDGSPFVMPTTHWRVGDELFIHGARKSRLVEALAAGAQACVTVSLIDGWVLARSAFHHSVNYRSVMLFGTARPVEEEAEKRAALDALLDKIRPGRSREARAPNAAELRTTALLAFPIAEASAKVRNGPPADAEADMALPVWAGLIPLTLTAGEPVECG